MKILVTVKTRASKEKVEQLTQPTLGLGSIPELLKYKVSVKAPPVDGEANEAIIKVLAEHFQTKTYNIRITSGHTSNKKIVEIITT